MELGQWRRCACFLVPCVAAWKAVTRRELFMESKLATIFKMRNAMKRGICCSKMRSATVSATFSWARGSSALSSMFGPPFRLNYPLLLILVAVSRRSANHANHKALKNLWRCTVFLLCFEKAPSLRSCFASCICCVCSNSHRKIHRTFPCMVAVTLLVLLHIQHAKTSLPARVVQPDQKKQQDHGTKRPQRPWDGKASTAHCILRELVGGKWLRDCLPAACCL